MSHTSQISQTSNQQTTHLACLLFLAIITLTIFSQSLHYPFFKIDDSAYVTENGDIRRVNLEMMKRWATKDYVLLYIPVTIASFAADYELWHLNVFGYRFTNLLLHIFSAFLLYFFILKITKNWLLALAVSAIFSIHPVQIESVAWVSERKNVLSAFFALLSLHSYLNKHTVRTFIFFLLGILSKPIAGMLPLIFLLLPLAHNEDGELRKQKWLLIGSMLIATVICFSVTVGNHSSTEIHFRGGTFLSNAYVMMVIFFRYIKLLIYPFDQQIFYMNKVYYSFLTRDVILAFVGIVLILTWIVFNIRKRPRTCFWFLWYLIFLIPVSNLFTPIGTLMNDRYLYLPLIGFFAGCFELLRDQTNGFIFGDQSWRGRFASFGVLACFLVPFIFLSFFRVQDWKTSTSVLDAGIIRSVYPDARFFVGKAADLIEANNKKGASEAIDRALISSPTEEAVLWRIQNDLEAKDLNDAAKLLSMMEHVPAMAQPAAYLDLYGLYYMQKESYGEAEGQFLKAIEKDKWKLSAHIHLAQLYRKQKEYAKATAILNKALWIDPDSDKALAELCNVYLKQKKYDDAYTTYLQLSKLYPDNPYVKIIAGQMAAVKTT